ncbi:hypothetical protein, partial [Clavibacter michiganensis]|uniref:hypothetical protein n=1 Tax=Clavibacter michiganensis TaxID=28447 RepID=UPI00292ECA68
MRDVSRSLTSRDPDGSSATDHGETRSDASAVGVPEGATPAGAASVLVGEGAGGPATRTGERSGHVRCPCEPRRDPVARLRYEPSEPVA